MSVEIREPRSADEWSVRSVTEDSLPPGFRPWVAVRDGVPVARLATGMVAGLADAPGRTGVIGWYEAGMEDAGVVLLEHARDGLQSRGADRVIGPMNGSTWARYRLALPAAPDETTDPPFVGEPVNPPEYVSHFRAAGFRAISLYESRWVADPASPPPGATVALRPLDEERFDAEIRAIYDLSLRAFAGNAFFSPISREEFRARYEAVRPLLDPELVWLSEGDDGALQGIAFALPDPYAPRVVLKTLATAPEARGRGIAAALTAAVHRAAAERGVGVVHALMQVTNASVYMSHQHHSTVFRRYALFGA